MKRVLNVLMAVCFLGLTGMAMAKGGTKVIDPTKTTFGWAVYTDKETTTKLDVVKGVDHQSALRLSYTFGDCEWIALVKETTFSMETGDAIKFNYKGTGAVLNLKVKVSDGKGTVFGFDILTGTKAPKWQTVVIPKNDFNYLYGGDGKIDWNALVKFEVTLDDSAPMGSYVINKDKPGILEISNIRIVKSFKAVVPGSRSMGKRLSDGSYLLDPLVSPDDWASYADQDGKCDLSTVKMISNAKTKRSIKALKAVYNFGKDGVWVAIVKMVNLDLSKMKMVEFYYRGTGGANSLQFKLTDGKERVYGYTLNETTARKSWKKVIIPEKSLKYLYGGPAEAPIDLSDIKKIEFTIEKKDAATPGGTLYLRLLKYN